MGGDDMDLKDLLVIVDNDPACASRVDVATTLAREHEAHLTGLHVVPWPPPMPYTEVPLAPELERTLARELEEEARRAEATFRARAERGEAHVEWRKVEGHLLPTATLHARYADLTIVGQGLDLVAAGNLAVLPETLALGVGRPVLVVPRYGTFPSVGRRVLVAWNGSREATRAVNDAIPILRRAAEVTVLSINAWPGARCLWWWPMRLARGRSASMARPRSALVVLAAGYLAGLGRLGPASAIFAVTALVLVEKSRIHGLVHRIRSETLEAAARFAVLALVVLPLLPEGPFGPGPGLRPRELWALVLVFSGLSFAGFVAPRVVGGDRGWGLSGMLGGLISSTAVTLTHARESRQSPGLGRALAWASSLPALCSRRASRCSAGC
jgi:nucleotide-binding universal stress UspA family protein